MEKGRYASINNNTRFTLTISNLLCYLCFHGASAFYIKLA